MPGKALARPCSTLPSPNSLTFFRDNTQQELGQEAGVEGAGEDSVNAGEPMWMGAGLEGAGAAL